MVRKSPLVSPNTIKEFVQNSCLSFDVVFLQGYSEHCKVIKNGKHALRKQMPQQPQHNLNKQMELISVTFDCILVMTSFSAGDVFGGLTKT